MFNRLVMCKQRSKTGTIVLRLVRANVFSKNVSKFFHCVKRDKTLIELECFHNSVFQMNFDSFNSPVVTLNSVSLSDIGLQCLDTF